MATQVQVVRGSNGKLPRFLDMASGNGQSTMEWTAEQALCADHWLPVSVRLLPENLKNTQVDLAYGIMDSESQMGGDSHVIELCVSGCDVSLVANLEPDRVPAKVATRARRIEKWCTNTFDAICDELTPDYAGERMESALQPPLSLIASSDHWDLLDLYISESLASARYLEAQLGALADRLLRKRDHGSSIGRKPKVEMTSSEREIAATVIRRAITKAYKLPII